ncbi:MAG TPA: folate-binding protein [Candidatus Sulfotelmatobacter sp.]|jgi:folate-binding protein YgfZ
MGLTALQNHAEGLGAASVAEYRGATTAARFGDPQAEFGALRSRCGVYDLGFRTKISLTGDDRVRWLNGMVTNNIRDLSTDQGVYSFLLNPQGHILGDLYAYNRGDSITVDMDCSQAEKILATFDHYIIMDDVEVTNLSDRLTALGVAGPRCRAVLQAAGLNFPELQPLQLHILECDCDCGCPTCMIVRSDDASNESYEVWMAPAHVRPVWDALLKAGAVPVGSEALEMQRIVSGIPRNGVDIRERDLPQETEQARALNFNKGCYVGQEIVERIRSRGAVHRKFTGFLSDARGIAPGVKVVSGGKDVGEVTSAASIQVGDRTKTLALGYIRREIGVPGREVLIGEAKAMVVQLPLAESHLLREENSLEQRQA